jgi:hypothetical protein
VIDIFAPAPTSVDFLEEDQEEGAVEIHWEEEDPAPVYSVAIYLPLQQYPQRRK